MCSWSFPAGVVQSIPSPSERNPEPLEIIEQRHEMAEIAPESIQTPAHDDIYPSPLGILDQRIEGGAAFLRTAHPFIDVFPCDRPPTGVGVSA
jgi:hypothetical protein